MTTCGPARVADAKALIDAVLRDERYRPGLKVLVDHAGLAGDEVTEDDVREVAEYMLARGDELATTIVAVVAPAAEHYGFTRRWRTLTGDELGVLAGVFYSHDAAAEWLRRVPPR